MNSARGFWAYRSFSVSGRHALPVQGVKANDEDALDLTRRAGAIVRDIDCFARLGGEESALLLPYAGTAAMHAAQRLRQLLERLAPGALPMAAYTVSIGVATLDTETPVSALPGRADAALYEAKHAGRNVVRLAETACACG
jgi:diguanylate cyclase (GGDEF)-like protein